MWPTAASLVAALLLVAGCTEGPRSEPSHRSDTSHSTSNGADTFGNEQPRARSDEPSNAAVRPGAQVLADRGFDLLSGRRVGLIVNHTARVGDDHLVDLVAAAPNVELATLFGPEHGLRGEADAGEQVADGRDARTGVPIFSLYGQTRRPTPEMLDDVDVLVFDIQDVGARFYTYISTMGLAMQAAAENDVAFVVLDRPNPLGGNYVSGFLLEEDLESFVGQYPIPMAHGLTVGELARMIHGEAMLPGLEDLDLHVVAAEDWRRDMLWPETGLTWIAPSPNIPDFETALVYPGAVLFEATSASEGRGTREPFKQLGATWADGAALAAALNARQLPGVRFEPTEFVPESIEGMAGRPKLEGETIRGIRYVVTQREAFEPVETGVHVLQAFYAQATDLGIDDFISRPEWLARLSGTHELLELLRERTSPGTIIDRWDADVAQFRETRRPYLLY